MKGDIQLSENFWLSEFTRSDIAKRKKLSNVPTVEALENLRYLCQAVLQPLRNALGKSVTVSSGYRSKEVNLLAGGVPGSQHERGEAADISAKGVSIEELARKVFELSLPVDQCIVEYDQNVLHVSIVKPRLQYLSRSRVGASKKIVYQPFDPSRKPIKSRRKKPLKSQRT
jgi:zinc D-Ala-D-Ala carboxypeptidase